MKSAYLHTADTPEKIVAKIRAELKTTRFTRALARFTCSPPRPRTARVPIPCLYQGPLPGSAVPRRMGTRSALPIGSGGVAVTSSIGGRYAS
jgi:hypothetical protein